MEYKGQKEADLLLGRIRVRGESWKPKQKTTRNPKQTAEDTQHQSPGFGSLDKDLLCSSLGNSLEFSTSAGSPEWGNRAKSCTHGPRAFS